MGAYTASRPETGLLIHLLTGVEEHICYLKTSRRYNVVAMVDEADELRKSIEALYKRLDRLHEAMRVLYEQHRTLHREGEEVRKELERLKLRMNELSLER